MLTVAIFLPLIGAIAIAALPQARATSARWMALAVASGPLAIMAVAWTRFRGGTGFDLVERVEWIPTLGVSYAVGVDGISLPLAAMTALVFLAAVAYPFDTQGRPRAYFALVLFLEAASLGLFLALDLFLFYVFFDVSLVGMYFLIAGWGHGDARRSALKFFIYTLAGSLVMLLAILGLYLATDPRTFDMAAIIANPPLPAGGAASTLIFFGFFLGFGVKTPLVPFHTWLPPAHVDAPAPASAILAGVLLKMGTYGLIRIPLQMMPGTFQRFADIVIIVAVVSIVYGALVALAQTNLKRLIAYTSINHMGYAVLGVGAAAAVGDGNARTLALTGATLEMVAHGLITGTLFLLAGSVLARTGSYEMDELGGLAARAPAFTAATAVAAFASLGLPGLAGFVAEFQIFAGALAVRPVLAGIGLLGIVITAALFLRMLQQVLLGPLPPQLGGWPDLGEAEKVVVGALLAVVVLIGVAPGWLLEVIDGAAGAIVRAVG